MPDNSTQHAWNLKAVYQGAALKRLRTQYGDPIDWGDIRVAHLDTGYTPHPAFGTWTPIKIGAVDAERNDEGIVLVEEGRNFFDPGKSPFGAVPKDPLFDPPLSIFQQAGHGTRTGSALSAIAGMEAIAPGLPIVPYRVNDNSLIGAQACQAIGDAIRHAIDHSRCQIVAISLGFPTVADTAMGRGIDYAYDNGVIVVGAGGQQTDRFCYPARHARAIGVAGVTRDHRNYNPYHSYARVDAWAPADYVWRGHVRKPEKFSPGDPLPPSSFSYGNGEGTSYAVPHLVAAAAAWLRLNRSKIDQSFAQPWQRIEAFRRILKQPRSAVEPVWLNLPFKSPGNNRAGLVDFRRLLAPAGPPKWPPAKELWEELDFAGDDLV